MLIFAGNDFFLFWSLHRSRLVKIVIEINENVQHLYRESSSSPEKTLIRSCPGGEGGGGDDHGVDIGERGGHCIMVSTLVTPPAGQQWPIQQWRSSSNHIHGSPVHCAGGCNSRSVSATRLDRVSSVGMPDGINPRLQHAASWSWMGSTDRDPEFHETIVQVDWGNV